MLVPRLSLVEVWRLFGRDPEQHPVVVAAFSIVVGLGNAQGGEAGGRSEVPLAPIAESLGDRGGYLVDLATLVSKLWLQLGRWDDATKSALLNNCCSPMMWTIFRHNSSLRQLLWFPVCWIRPSSSLECICQAQHYLPCNQLQHYVVGRVFDKYSFCPSSREGVALTSEGVVTPVSEGATMNVPYQLVFFGASLRAQLLHLILIRAINMHCHWKYLGCSIFGF